VYSSATTEFVPNTTLGYSLAHSLFDTAILKNIRYYEAESLFVSYNVQYV